MHIKTHQQYDNYNKNQNDTPSCHHNLYWSRGTGGGGGVTDDRRRVLFYLF